MVTLEAPFRRARPDDDVALCDLINFAGEGLPEYLWAKMVEPGETAFDVGRRRARRDEGGFSYRNGIVVEERGDVVAGMIGYGLADDPAPSDYDSMPAMFVPLQQLEDMAPGTWYLNVLAAYPEHRRRGHGRALLGIAERLAAAEGKRGVSMILSEANEGALRLYETAGYRFVSERPMVKEAWHNPGNAWVLLIKELAEQP